MTRRKPGELPILLEKIQKGVDSGGKIRELCDTYKVTTGQYYVWRRGGRDKNKASRPYKHSGKYAKKQPELHTIHLSPGINPKLLEALEASMRHNLALIELVRGQQ